MNERKLHKTSHTLEHNDLIGIGCDVETRHLSDYDETAFVFKVHRQIKSPEVPESRKRAAEATIHHDIASPADVKRSRSDVEVPKPMTIPPLMSPPATPNVNWLGQAPIYHEQPANATMEDVSPSSPPPEKLDPEFKLLFDITTHWDPKWVHHETAPNFGPTPNDYVQ